MWVSWFRVRLSQPRGMLRRVHTQHTHTRALSGRSAHCIHMHKHTHKHRLLQHTCSKPHPLSLIQPLTHTNVHSTSGLRRSRSCMASVQVRGVVRDSHFINHIWGTSAFLCYVFPYVVSLYSTLTSANGWSQSCSSII